MTPANRTSTISVGLGLSAIIVLLAGLASMDAFDSATLMYELINGGTSSFVVPALVLAAGLALAAIITGHIARHQPPREKRALVGLLSGYILLGGLALLGGMALLVRMLVEVFW